MDAAKSAIHKFTGNRGHRTEVEEVVNPAVTKETVKHHRHEEMTQAIDREVHQDHYHTTVQPLQHKEVLPEQHKHNVLPVEQREFQHGNDTETRQRVQAELGQFRDHSITQPTQHTQTAGPSVTGEHVHHHVHEIVQPVVNKETIRPEVVHTTVPIHETHHAPAEHHGMSALPMKTLDEFTKAGGVLSGTKGHHAHEKYEGAPRPYNSKLQTDINKLGLGGAGVGAGAGAAGAAGAAGLAARHHHRSGSGSSSSSSSSDEEGRRNGTRRVKDTSHPTNDTKQPTLLDRLNPLKDADRDGKPGVME